MGDTPSSLASASARGRLTLPVLVVLHASGVSPRQCTNAPSAELLTPTAATPIFFRSEGNDLYHEMVESGVIKVNGNSTEGSKAALVYGQMNEPPGARARVALTGLTIAEYFRDEEGQDVLLFVDNIFRFTQVGSTCPPLLCL